MNLFQRIASALLFVTAVTCVRASVMPLSLRKRVAASDAVFRGTVVGMVSYRNATNRLIYTRTSLRVDEPLKGRFPTVLQVVHRGGRVQGEDEYDSLSPRFIFGAEYLMFVKRGLDGTLQCLQGYAGALELHRVDATSPKYVPADQALLEQVRKLTHHGHLAGADVTDQAGQEGAAPMALTGLLGGVATRFILPDQGRPIPYLVDADSLPVGITLTQATNAVAQALNAWAAVTSLKFQFAGLQSFGQGADTIAATDGFLRIQLHDNYNSINSPDVLGVGGRDGITSPVPGDGWDLGGNVAGNEFFKTVRGFVVLEATNTALQVLSTFTEVLCHEIGHALNMAHSSETNTTDPLLTNSIMYYQVHADGRGATLGAYDPPVIDQMYPSNTPPYTFDRFLDVTTAPSTPAVSGINEVVMEGYDLQSTNLTIILANATTTNGTFSQAGNIIRYTPAGYFNDSPRLDPAGYAYYDMVYARVSDGTNASPYAEARVISLTHDSATPSDGIPDYWMTNYFGHIAPSAGDQSRASDDPDHDGINNLDEYRSGMNPLSADSAQIITSLSGSTLQWQARAYDLYEIQQSTNLTSWTRTGFWTPTNAPITTRTNYLAAPITAAFPDVPTNRGRLFFRIRRVP